MKVRIFDVCVLGNSVGGLVCALMLQKRGAKVLVIKNKKTMDFDPGLCEFLNGFTVKPVLKRAGFHPTEVNSIPSLDAPLQLTFAEHRLDCFGDERRFDRELRREFPARADKILQLFKESYGHLEVYQHIFNSRVAVPPKGFFARRQFANVLEQICDVSLLKDKKLEQELRTFDVGDDFGRAVNAMELAMSNLVTTWTTGARLAHLLTLVRWEGYAAPQGVVTLRDMLLTKIHEKGGLIASCDDLKQLQLDGKKIQAIDLKGAEWDQVGTKVVVVSGDPRGLISMEPKNSKMMAWKESLDQLPIFARKAYQIYRLAPEGIPIGMQPQGLIVPPPKTDPGPERRRRLRALKYVVRRIEKQGQAPEINLGLTAFMAPEGQLPEPSKVSREIREAILELIPFLNMHLLEEPKDPFMPAMEGSPGDFRQGFIYTSDGPRELAVGGLEPTTPFKNVFQAGDQLFPGLGLDGEIIGGMQAAHVAGGYLSSHSK